MTTKTGTKMPIHSFLKVQFSLISEMIIYLLISIHFMVDIFVYKICLSLTLNEILKVSV